MIQIARTSSLEDLKLMVPHFVYSVPEDADIAAQRIIAVFIQQPERLFVVKVITDGELSGFCIAECGQGEDAWVLQAWNNPDSSLSVASEVFNRVVLWALSLGKARIHAQTQRSSEALFRRFGFVDTAKILTHHVDQSIIPEIMSTFRKEFADGQQR